MMRTVIRRLTRALLPALLLPLGMLACTPAPDAPQDFRRINGREAKEIMEREESYVLIDARTQSEYDTGHIPGAILMPETEVASRAESEIPDKDALILVYCRSGRRSKIAAQALVDLGYTNVYEFGGIIDWEYETVTE